MKKIRYALAGIFIVLVAVTSVIVLQKGKPAARLSLPAVDLNTKSRGPIDAPVQIIEYSDFQCPACKFAEPVLDAILNDPEYAQKIRLVYRHFPLSGHTWAGPAHQAAECAKRHGKFWEYHHKLYTEQEKWSALPNPLVTFMQYAQNLEMSPDWFAACLTDTEVQQQILAEKNFGMEVEVKSTPTFFINEERVVGPLELANRGTELIRQILGLPPKPQPTPSPQPSPSPSLVS